MFEKFKSARSAVLCAKSARAFTLKYKQIKKNERTSDMFMRSFLSNNLSHDNKNML